MKLKLSVALSAAFVLIVGVPAWGAVIPGDEGTVTPTMVDEIAQLGGSSARAGSATSPTTANKHEFAHRSDAQALALAVDQDPALFGPQPTRALLLPPGATVKNYLDDFAARIDIPGQGPDVIASSTTPLRVQRAGVKRAVDLKLIDRGKAIEPTAPVAPMSFSKRLGDGIVVGDNIRVRVVGAHANSDARVAGQQVFYANALRDADVFATPLPSGLETFVQLRSAESPTTIVYAFELPAGARLVQQPGEHAGAAVIDGTRVLATIAAPVSIDANDHLVPTTMRVDGSRLVLDVAVTESTALPVLVDPVIDNQFAGGDVASGYGSFANVSGWRRETSGPFGNFTFSPNSDSSYSGGGCYRVYGGQLVSIGNQLCVSTQSSRYYSGEVGQWSWRPPTGIRGPASDGPNIATDAYIYRAYVRHSFTRYTTSGNAYMYGGLHSGRTGSYIGSSTNIDEYGNSSDYRAGGWTSGVGYNGAIFNGSFLRQYCAAPNCSVEHPNEPVYDGAWFAFGLYAVGSGHSASANAQGAVFYQYDRTPPAITHTASSDVSAWKRTGTVSTIVTGTDVGMGMQTVGVSYTNKDGQTTSLDRPYGCTGTTQSPCQPVYAQSFATNIDNLPEGNATISSTAKDVLEKPAVTSPTVTVKVDRTPPTTTMTGSLSADGDNYVNGQQPASFVVSSAEPAATHAIAGVAHVGLTDGGAEIAGASADVSCPTSSGSRQCPATPDPVTLAFNTSVLSEGSHDIRGIGRDDAGNTGPTDPLTVVVDRTAPAFGASDEFFATLDADTHQAVVLWDPAADPMLPDGSVGSTTSMYDVRYRLGSAAWSATQRVNMPRALVSNATIGQQLSLEISPIDSVGNVGATKSVTLTIGSGGSVCAATAEGYPAECDGDDATPESAEGDEPVELVPDTALRSDNQATRYHISIQSGPWTTFRSWTGSYAIGNVRDGWSFDRLNNDETVGPLEYTYGKVRGSNGFESCGWVQVRFQVNPSGTVVANCPTSRRYFARDFTDAVSCNKCGGGRSYRVTKAMLDALPHKAMQICLNIDPSPLVYADNPTCRNGTRSRITRAALDSDQDGVYALKWRYITRGKTQYVMVQDREYIADGKRAQGNWVFIPRRDFRDRHLCDHPSGVGNYNCDIFPP